MIVFVIVFPIMIMIALMMRMGLFSWLAGARTMGELWRRCLGRPSSALAGYLRMSLLDNIIPRLKTLPHSLDNWQYDHYGVQNIKKSD